MSIGHRSPATHRWARFISARVNLFNIVMDMVNEDEVTEVEGIKLASSVQVGDLGSIIFPAAKALLSWLRHQECIESKYVLGN